jgi:hypothetical protein
MPSPSRWLITHLSALYICTSRCHRSAMCAASNYNDRDNRDRTAWRHGKSESTPSLTKVFRRRTSHLNFFAKITSVPMSFRFCADGVAVLASACITKTLWTSTAASASARAWSLRGDRQSGIQVSGISNSSYCVNHRDPMGSPPPVDVCFGSKANIAACPHHVRFTPESQA